MAAQGTPAVYFVITPDPGDFNWHIKGTSRANTPIAAFFIKFGDATHGASYADTKKTNSNRYSTCNPTFSMAVNPATVGPVGGKNYGKYLEDTLLKGYEWVVKDGKVTEWHDLRLKTAYIANPQPFSAELLRLQRRFAGSVAPADNNPRNAALNFNDDVVNTLDFYCAKFG